MSTLWGGAGWRPTPPAASWELNQPRVWSGPSTIQSTGHHRRNSSSRPGYPRLAQPATPLSHQTSRMSGTRRMSSRHFGHVRRTSSMPGRWRSMPSLYPRPRRNASDEDTTVVWPHFVHLQIGRGVPQYRWREIPQSFRFWVQSICRAAPAHSGYQATLRTSSIIFGLIASTRRNHWTVARYRIGVLQRQQWPYAWTRVVAANRASAWRRSSIIVASASFTPRPAYAPASFVKRPRSSTGLN